MGDDRGSACVVIALKITHELRRGHRHWHYDVKRYIADLEDGPLPTPTASAVPSTAFGTSWPSCPSGPGSTPASGPPTGPPARVVSHALGRCRYCDHGPLSPAVGERTRPKRRAPEDPADSSSRRLHFGADQKEVLSVATRERDRQAVEVASSAVTLASSSRSPISVRLFEPHAVKRVGQTLTLRS